MTISLYDVNIVNAQNDNVAVNVESEIIDDIIREIDPDAPSISVQTDGYLYSPRERVTISGKVQNFESDAESQFKILLIVNKSELNLNELKLNQLKCDELNLNELKCIELKCDELKLDQSKCDELKLDQSKCDESKRDELKCIEYRVTHLISSDGYFVDKGLITGSEGDYVVRAIVSIDGKEEEALATFKIESTDFFENNIAYLIISGIANFFALMIVISLKMRNATLVEILRFVFISGIAISGVLVFLLIDTDIGSDAPIGLVSKNVFDEITGEVLDTSWVINIGGHPLNDFQQGIQIPVFVVIFGIAGGYLRYLYKTATLKFNSKTYSDKKPDAEYTLLFHTSLQDLVLFLLAPLLAIAVWFLLLESEMHSLNILALASFTAGLVTNEIVQTLINFMRKLLKTLDDDSESKPAPTISSSSGTDTTSTKSENLEKND